jgi:hypothetical protein
VSPRAKPVPSLLLALAFFLAAAAPAAAAGPAGVVETFDQGSVQVREFHDLADQYVFVVDGAANRAPLADIQSLTRTAEGVVLKTWDGRRFTVKGGMDVSRSEEIRFTMTNPVTGEPQRAALDPLLVRRISFDRPVRAD